MMTLCGIIVFLVLEPIALQKKKDGTYTVILKKPIDENIT